MGTDQETGAASGEKLALDDLVAWLSRLQGALKEKHGGFFHQAGLHLYGDGSHSLTVSCLGDNKVEARFEGQTVAELIAAASAWIERDEVAELNETLGLTADGRFRTSEPGAAP